MNKVIIDFENMQEKVLENFNGGEKALITKMSVDERNKILYRLGGLKFV